MSEDHNRAMLELLEAASNDNHSHPLDRIRALAIRAVNNPADVTADEIRDIAWTALLFAHREFQRGSTESIDDQVRKWQAGLVELDT